MDHVARKETPPHGRLERWLSGTLEGGGLRGLPSYSPLGKRLSLCPEQYARVLLAALRADHADQDHRERLRDDARAFRSWAELALVPIRS